MPVLKILSKDKVANIRMNTAKTLCTIYDAIISDNQLRDQVMHLLRNLVNDPDGDVQFYAKQLK